MDRSLIISETATLFAHIAAPCQVARLGVEAVVQRADDVLTLQYTATGDAVALAVPVPVSAQRRDELWRHTCAELFVAVPGDTAYCEFNFSPSGAWAAYRFEGYRAGMQPLLCVPPAIEVWHDVNTLRMSVQCFLPMPWSSAAVLQMGLTMVLEDQHGQCSYWALNHSGDKPDFHRRDSFVWEL